MYQFTDDCLIGIANLDNEHRKLFEMINELHTLLAQPPADSGSLAKAVLNDLKDYAATHFAHEEAYMEQIGDPELPRQKQAHADFVKELASYESGTLTEETADKALNEMLTFLTRWLYRHILSSDMMIGKLTPKTEPVTASEDPFAFTEKYHTGIALVDEEHKRLFEIIREANDLIHAEFLHDKFDKIMHIIDELRDYTEFHFRDEEAYMEQIHYPGLDAQKLAHAAFVDRLTDIDLSKLDEIDDNQQGYLVELIDYLLGWLSNHILKMDKKIGA